ncbi:MAG: GNAT family N-acetyltransferase [Ruaniaceae bacterium]|nr:GNAT family N-acetyltransferase [Ruaniaceae bacterium]
MEPVTLTGHGLILRPLVPRDAAELFGGIDAALWSGMATPLPGSADELAELFVHRLEIPDALFFVVVDQISGALAGSTAFYDIAPHRLEIGHTFYLREHWGTLVNPATKLLLLGHAFETLGVGRVAFRCDSRNERSARAIERLGAAYEGTLRHHRIDPVGNLADTAYFSILADEWPRVRDGLRGRLSAGD